MLTSKPASFNRKKRIGSQQSAVGKEVLVRPKRVARKRSGGVFAWVFPLGLREGSIKS